MRHGLPTRAVGEGSGSSPAGQVCDRPVIGRLLRAALLALSAVLAPAAALRAEPPATQPASAPAARPLLWVIEGKTPSYLFGTIHVPDERVMNLPRVVEEALGACHEFYAEIPMDAEAMVSVLPRTMLPGGRTIADVLPKALYERTEAYVKRKGFSLAIFERARVPFVAVQIALLDYLDDMALRLPLDMALYTQALGTGKEVGGLETVDEQMSIFEDMSDEDGAKMLSKTLDMIEEAEQKGVNYVEQLMQLYLAGDEAGLLGFMHQSLDPNDDFDRRFIRVLLTDRNARMARRIVEKLEKEPGRAYFFAIGAGHLAGDDGVLTLLGKKGLKLRRLAAADAGRLPRPADPRDRSP